VAFPPIPCFSPELFAYLRCPPAQRKAFAKGVEGLLGEGAVQVLYSRDEYITDPILAAVGQLQFEVVQYRMKDEYGEYCLSLYAWEGLLGDGRILLCTVAEGKVVGIAVLHASHTECVCRRMSGCSAYNAHPLSQRHAALA
jgi:hypothetical protein